MKLPRNTRIFRGQLDVAPVACVFFMTALMLFLHSQTVFVPGVRLDLHPSNITNQPSLYIDSQDVFHYAGSAMSQASFSKRLRAEAEKSKAPASILLQTDQGASTNAVNEVRTLAAELSIGLEAPGTRILLPELPDQPGAKSPSVIVAVNLNGQFFYENQLVRDVKDLQSRLGLAARASKEPLTLILRLDRSTQVDTFVRLSEMARNAGFKDVIVATREPLKPTGETIF